MTTGEHTLLYDQRPHIACWSPNGRYVAFGGVFDWNTEDQHVEIFVVDADGSNLMRNASNGGSDSWVWSPDGRYLAFRGDNQTAYLLDMEKQAYCPLGQGIGDFSWRMAP